MIVIEIFLEVLSWALIVSGSAFVIVGSLGIWRLPDFWARLHGASVTESAGMILLIWGMCIQAGFTLITVKLIIIGVFLFITGPTATHAVANAALVTGWRPTEAKGLTGAEPEPLESTDDKRASAEGPVT